MGPGRDRRTERRQTRERPAIHPKAAGRDSLSSEHADAMASARLAAFLVVAFLALVGVLSIVALWGLRP